MDKHGFLFCGSDMSAVLEAQGKRLRSTIGELEANYVCRVDEAELASSLADQYRIDVPVLDVGARTADSREEKRQGRGNFEVFEYTVNVYSIRIPFIGEAAVFSFRPNQTDLNPPRATVDGQELVIVIEQRSPDAIALGNEIQTTTASIEKYLRWLREMVEPFNGQLLNVAREAIRQRKQKVSKDVDVLVALGIPVRRRDTLPSTVSIPVQRTSIPLPKPMETKPAESLDPVISEKVYRQIIKTMADMALVIERNPTAFEHLSEEEIRFQFLIPLNALYEGNATAETFSYQGKTDIQIRHGGKPIFTAECKFWGGPKSLTETVDQLLAYVTWRDTKTAILLFNKNKNFSQVLEQIEPTLRAHSGFVRFEGKKNETEYQFAISHPNDAARYITLTVLAFDIPRNN
jgi:hypothetical protein